MTSEELKKAISSLLGENQINDFVIVVNDHQYKGANDRHHT